MKGRRKTTRPQPKSKTPTTALLLVFKIWQRAAGKRLTVKLVKSPPDATEKATASSGLGNCTVLKSLAQVDLEHKEQGNSDTGQDEGDPTETPSPVLDISNKGGSSLGTSKRGDHVRRRSKGKSQTSVPQVGRIGSENTDSVDHASETDRIEDLCGTESSEVLRDGHEDETKSGETAHEEESFSTAPDVKSLSHGNVASCGHGG